MCEALISFAGAALGGVVTLLGVAWTIKYYVKQEVKEAERERSAGIITFYNFLLVKVNLLRKIHNCKTDDERNTIIEGGSVYTEAENLFLYERIHFIKTVLDEDDLLELLAFMGQLQQFEAVRRSCECELDKNNMVIHKSAYEEHLNNCVERLQENPKEGTMGILKMLSKMEEYLDDIKR